MRAVVLTVIVCLSAQAVQAEVIERACMASDRAAASRALCGCIQDAANRTLTTRDQRLAASFFDEPDRAQEIRMSDRRTHEVFWERYKTFGETAEAFCSS